MRRFLTTALHIVALILLLFGLFLVVDGLLPTHSRGPNPSWVEVGIGVFVGTTGWVLRRVVSTRLGVTYPQKHR